MKHLIICLGIFFSLFGYGHAQTPDQIKKSTETLNKMRQIDLLTQIIPLALTKEQIDKLLPAVERARARVALTQKDEAKQLASLDAKLSAAIKHSIENTVPPPKELLLEVAKATLDMSEKRGVVIDENTDAVLKVFNDTLNAGQKKAAANSLAPQLFDPNLKPDKMTEEEKIRFFIGQILLDPQCYDLLLELEKHAPAGGGTR